MNELSRHIERLLIEGDCVIVPELGGFVAQYVMAHYDAEAALFSPPMRRIAFNARLTMNDGLLVQAYMQARRESFPIAKRRVEEAVREVREQLRKNGAYTLDNIGRLSLRLDNSLDFTPSSVSLSTPELYGLEVFHIACLDAAPAAISAPVRTETPEATDAEVEAPEETLEGTPEDNPGKRHYVLRIPHELVNYAAAAVIAALCYFLWIGPNGTPSTSVLEGSVTAASLLPDTAVPVEVDKAPAEQLAETTNTAQEESPVTEAAPEAVAMTSDETPSAPYFTIVVISAIPLNNAETYAAQLAAEGMEAVSVRPNGDYYRVVVGTFASEAEAANQIRSLHADPRFEQAWVLKVVK